MKELSYMIRFWGSEFEINTSFEFKGADNTELDGGKIVIDDTIGDGVIKLASGVTEAIYETVEFNVPEFNRLVMSWNADTPDGSWVEVKVRSSIDGTTWNKPVSWGKWSPFSQDYSQGIRCSFSCEGINTDEYAIEGILIQILVTLHRNDAFGASPVLRLLHGTLRNTSPDKTIIKKYPEAEFINGGTDSFFSLADVDCFIKRQSLESQNNGYGVYIEGIPQYSQQLRGPVDERAICSATSISMIINGLSANEGKPYNRLVEEISLSSFDYKYNGYGNWSYTVAQAGAFGFQAYVEYSDKESTETIKRHLLSGHALAISVTYSHMADNINYLEGAQGTTTGHLITLLGIIWRDGEEYIISQDSWAGNTPDANELVYREYKMNQFKSVLQSSSAVLYVVKPGIVRGAGTAAPKRLVGILKEMSTGSYELFDILGNKITIDATPRPRPNGYMAYTTEKENFLGKNPTRYSYVPLGSTIHLPDDITGCDDFKMYVIMGNGYTYFIDKSHIERKASNHLSMGRTQ